MSSKASVRLAKLVAPKTELGLSAAELAKRLGVTRQAVHQWITGKNPPSLEMCRKLEIETGIPMREWTEKVPRRSAASS